MTWEIDGRYDFCIPEAQRLADLSGIQSDLKAVIRLCKTFSTDTDRLVRKPEEDPTGWFDDLQMIGDIAFGAIVRYGRTLATGIRSGVPSEWIEELPEHLRDAHRYFKALRDKYIAHSVNAWEDNQVFVFLTPQFATEQTPSSITVDQGRLISPSLKEMTLLSELAVLLEQRVGTEIKSENERLLAIAKSMPIKDIRSRSTDSTPMPGNKETFQPRSKFKDGE